MADSTNLEEQMTLASIARANLFSAKIIAMIINKRFRYVDDETVRNVCKKGVVSAVHHQRNGGRRAIQF